MAYILTDGKNYIARSYMGNYQALIVIGYSSASMKELTERI